MRNFKNVLMVSIFIILCGFIKVEAKELPSGLNYNDVKTTIDSYIEKNKDTTVGLATIIYDEDGIIYKNLYGYTNKEENIVVDETSVFEWGSTSKLLIWVSAMQLQEQGKLDLHKDIREYLPKNFLKLKYDKKITMIDLMNHQAGFQEVYIGMAEKDRNKVLSLEESLKKYQPVQVFEPGKYTAYSNYGAALAAYIIERVSGVDYVEYVHKNIFDVLDMKDTAIGGKLDDNEDVYNRRIKLNVYNLDGSFLGDQISYVNFYPAGSGTGTLNDFYKFAYALTPNSKHKCPLFKNEATLKEMYTATSYYGSSKVENNYHGFFASQFKVNTLGHGGNTYGSSAMIQFDPVSHVGAVVFVNQAHETTYNYKMYELIFGNFKESKYSEIERKLPKGLMMNTRGVFKGPLKFMSAIGVSAFEESDLNSWWYQDGNIVYAGFSDNYIDAPKIIMNITIFLLFIIGSIYSLFTTISCIIHLFKRNKNQNNQYNYIVNICNALVFINTTLLFITLANGSVNGFMPSYSNVQIRIVITAILFIGLVISLMKALYNWKNDWKNIRKKTKVKYMITTIFMIMTIITILYFDMYQFWSIT